MGMPSTLVAMCVTVLIIFLFACLAEKGRIILFEKLGINNLLYHSNDRENDKSVALEKITQITCRYQFLNNQITISYHPVLNSGRFPIINNSLSMSLKIGVSLLQSDDSS